MGFTNAEREIDAHRRGDGGDPIKGVEPCPLPGDRLPSIRSFAATLGVSPSTVVEAYDRLVAEGLIRARRGSGFDVARTGLPARVLGEAEPRRDRAVDPFWVSRQSLDADPTVMKPGCGWLPADWMPNSALRRG